VIRTASLLGLAGVALATALFLWQGVGAVFAVFAAAGLGLVWASLFHFVPMALNARAWQILLPASRPAVLRPERADPRGPGALAFFLWAVWLREAVNGLLPVARVGGEVVSARLLIRRRLRASKAVASLVVDMTVSLASQFAFTLLGLGLLTARGASAGVVRDLGLGLIAALPVLAALLLVQRVGFFALLTRLFRMLFGRRFDALVGGAEPLDRTVRRLYRRQRAVLACFGWQLAGWIAGAGEIWLALYFLGYPVGAAEALIVEAVIQAVSSGAFVVPGALGVQEGGFLAIGALVGLPAEIALALALARRARDVIVFVPALVIWQVAAGRRALAVA
jgi:putative membrane protein